MKSKLFIYFGILSLTAGILLRAFDLAELPGLILIFLGAALKSTYIVLKLVKKEYKPGIELLFLIVGLSLFLCFRCSESPYAGSLMGLGIVLKVVFVVVFIRKMRGRSF